MRPLALVALLALAAPAAGAAVLTTKERALAAAWPEAEIERVRHFLSEDEAAAAAGRAGTALESRAVLAWRATREGRVLGTAYLDRHLVRTLPESVLVFVDPDGRVERIDILGFDEPRDYLPPERWLAQFEGRALGDELQVKRAIHGLTGATLSGRAVTEAVRRVLAVHEVLQARDGRR